MSKELIERLRKGSPHLGRDCELAASRIESSEAEINRLRKRVGELETELRIVASVPVPDSAEANSLGWLKARARSLVSDTGDAASGKYRDRREG